MDNTKNDKYYIDKIKSDLEFIIHHMKGVDAEEFAKHEILQDSMMFRLIQISENSKRTTELYRDSHSIIPWTAIYGLRNRIVHDYGHVDLTIVYETLTQDIPELLEVMEGLE